MKKSGFTLAGVSITLSIIVIIAAVAIPSIAASNRAKEYKASANEALSAITNTLATRIAFNGVAPANFAGSIGQFLVQPPEQVSSAGKAAEQTVLPTTFVSRGSIGTSKTFAANEGAKANETVAATLENGMIVHFPAGAASIITTGGCSNLSTGAGGCKIVVDTNGIKGPTRTPPGTNPEKVNTCRDKGMANNLDSNDNPAPATNYCPDVIQLRVRGTIVEAANQRTKNILASGNAMIAQ